MYEQSPTMQLFNKLFDKGKPSDNSFPNGYLNHEFESSCYRTNDYISFERKYRNYIKKNLPSGYSLHSFNGNHFEFSCVIETAARGFIYLSISDVRFFPNQWYNDILIRSMKHPKDWTGDSNRRARLNTLTEDISTLGKQMERSEAAAM
jgi:hypothetical protein